MIGPFTNLTVRSADDLSADLSACRQLRHISEVERQNIVDEVFDSRPLPRAFVWTKEAFELAAKSHGYCCDTCDVVTSVPSGRADYAAVRMLDNLDGKIKLLLCEACSRKFSTFCRREFDREARSNWTNELEQMMLAFVAYRTRILANRVYQGVEHALVQT